LLPLTVKNELRPLFLSAFAPHAPATYAVSCRAHVVSRKPRLETWAYPLALGRPLPPLPLWLGEGLVIDLDLEGSYEDTCRVLRIA